MLQIKGISCKHHCNCKGKYVVITQDYDKGDYDKYYDKAYCYKSNHITKENRKINNESIKYSEEN